MPSARVCGYVRSSTCHPYRSTTSTSFDELGLLPKEFCLSCDYEVVRTPLATDSPSLEVIFDHTADRVYAFLVSRSGNMTVAEDLTAETFSAASAKFSQGRGSEVTLAWLYTVARRRLIDYWRSESSRQNRTLKLINEASTQAPADEVLLDTAVDEALAALTPRYRAALALRYLDDFSVSEVAAALDSSYKATESLLARARAAFSAAYEEQP